MKLTDYVQANTERVLITGLPGSGKSTLAAELSKSFDLIWIDVENGASTLKKLPRAQQERITLIHLPDSSQYPIAADTCVSLFRNGKGNICTQHGKIDCALCKKSGAQFELVDFTNLPSSTIVVVDTVTQISHSILAHLMKNRPIDAKPEREDWGGLRKHTEFIASQWQAAEYNLVCIAHVTEAVMEDGKTKLVPNFGSASMSAEFGKFFGHIVYCETRNGKHVAGSATKYSNSVLTKSRTDFCIESMPVASLIPLFMHLHVPVAQIVSTAPSASPVIPVPQTNKTPAQLALERFKTAQKPAV